MEKLLKTRNNLNNDEYQCEVLENLEAIRNQYLLLGILPIDQSGFVYKVVYYGVILFIAGLAYRLIHERILTVLFFTDHRGVWRTDGPL